MGLLSEFFVQFSAKGVAETSAAFDTVEARAKRTSSAISDFGRQATSGLRAASAAMTGFTVAGLAGTTQGAQLTFQMQRLSREIASVALPVVQKLTSAVKGVADWFHGLSRGQQDTIMKFGLFTVGATLAISVVGRLATGIKSLAELYKALSAQLVINRGLALSTAAANATAAGSATAAAGGAAGGAAAAGGSAVGAAGVGAAGAATAGWMARARMGAAAFGRGLVGPALIGTTGAAIGFGTGMAINQYRFGAATPSGILDKKVEGKSPQEIYAESVRKRGEESFLGRWGWHTLNNLVPGIDLQPVSDQLKAKAIEAQRGRRDVTLAGGAFEGITDTFRRMQSATMRIGGNAPKEKTDEEIVAELKKLNQTMSRKLELGMG